MNRRNFIRVAGVGTVSMLAAPGFSGCASPDGLTALDPWKGPEVLTPDADVKLKIISYAILAPNAHNIQPWKVEIRDEAILLFVDPERLLPNTDPDARQIMISQGTFLEAMSIAALRYGFYADVKLFPDGVPPLEAIGTLPVATVHLGPTNVRYSIEWFSQIYKRHTNRSVYRSESLSQEEIKELTDRCDDKDFPLRLFTDTGEREAIAEMMTKGMDIESHTQNMHAETVKMIRFDDSEVEKHRDGLAMFNLGMSGIKLFFAKMFSSRTSAMEETFIGRTVEATRQAAFSAACIGLLSSPGSSRMDEVTAGRRFMRIFLTATQMGLSMQPMSQILEIESVRKSFCERFAVTAITPQMIFRLGKSNPQPHSARRKVDDFVVGSDQSG